MNTVEGKEIIIIFRGSLLIKYQSERLRRSDLFSCKNMGTIALKASYSEFYSDIIDDMKLLLEGTKGTIGLVMLVKLDALSDKTTKWIHPGLQV